MYAIIDIETTGSKPANDKITEIAIFLHDGNGVIDEFTTLINPECNIPYFITKLTGITNEMVMNAPKFYEVAKKVVEITDGATFVAHNSGFDYNFVRHEFKRLGYDYKRNQLCTVKLSRKYIPGFKSYSLGKICRSLGIQINGRHRAAGDALATVKLFEMVINKANGEIVSTGTKDALVNFDEINRNLNREMIMDIPEETGVYYFYSDKNDLIYIGKSKNIRSRILSHLSNKESKRAVEMKDQIADIGYETTGSELVALLKESEEIKIHKPHFNRSQRRNAINFGLYAFYDKRGYLNFRIQKNNQKDVPITTFLNSTEAKNFMYRNIEKHGLCQKLCGLYDSVHACFHFNIGLCKGACIGEEPAEDYNIRAEALIEQVDYEENNFIIIDKGRDDEEKSVIVVENGKYLGYGFFDAGVPVSDHEFLKEHIQPAQDNRDVKQIINQYLSKNKVEKLIKI